MNPTVQVPARPPFTLIAPTDEPTAHQLSERALALVDVLEAEHKAGADTAIARARLLAAVTDLSGAAARYDATRQQARCWSLLEEHAEEVVIRTSNGKLRVKWEGPTPFGRKLANILDAIARQEPNHPR